MSRKEDRIWGEGFERACQVAEEKGLEGLMAERKFRGVTGFTGRVTSSDLDKMDKDVKELIFATTRIAFCGVLHDEFNFGRKRIDKVMSGIDKLAEYMANGWIYWIDLVEEIRRVIGIDLSIHDGETHFLKYGRPENKDMYVEPDLIDSESWNSRIKSLGLVDDGKQVTDTNGRWAWKYDNPYDKVQIYDELGGIMLAVAFLGAKKPGEVEA